MPRSARNDQVPADVVAQAGGTGYNNFDTDASVMYDYTPDAAADVPAIVTGTYGAGRMQHGDFQWTFDNATQDTNDAIIPELKSALQDYQTMWIGFFTGATAIRELQRTPSDNQSFFDLQGRQIKRPVNHQVVVHNGHKYVSQ